MLARLRKAQDSDEGGFTLIELLVVMIIIGVLAAIAIPAFLSQRKKSFEASEKSDLRTIATEINSQAVDGPASIALSSATAGVFTVTATSAGTPAVVGTPANITLSPGNAWATPAAAGGSVTMNADGTAAYCVALTNPKAGSNWKISSNGANSQTIATGICP